jgi:hypothetical protein
MIVIDKLERKVYGLSKFDRILLERLRENTVDFSQVSQCANGDSREKT